MQYSYIPPHTTPAEKNFYANKKPFDLLVKGSNFLKSYQIEDTLLPKYIAAIMETASVIQTFRKPFKS